MKRILYCITLLLFSYTAYGASDKYYDCKDDPKLKGIVCKREVKILCPYDEKKKCRVLKDD